MLSPATSAATRRVSDRTAFTPAAEIEHCIRHFRSDSRNEPWLLGALLSGRVWVLDYEVVLGERGPYLELTTEDTRHGHTLRVYTSPEQMPEDADIAEAQSMPFAYVLRSLASYASLEINPEGCASLRLSPHKLQTLRRVLTTH